MTKVSASIGLRINAGIRGRNFVNFGLLFDYHTFQNGIAAMSISSGDKLQFKIPRLWS